MSRTAVIITPNDHGRRMSLEEFDQAEAAEGKLYELGKGVVVVVDVPDERHGAILDDLRDEFGVYRRANRGVIHRILHGSDCKVVVSSTDSEHHPDLAIYKSPRPDVDDYWAVWVPDIVIEVVSKSSVYRDYEEKPPEYLAFGVTEYWIVDPLKQQITFNRRVGGLWKPQVLTARAQYTTHVLPGFELDVATVLAAGN